MNETTHQNTQDQNSSFSLWNDSVLTNWTTNDLIFGYLSKKHFESLKVFFYTKKRDGSRRERFGNIKIALKSEFG